MMMETAADYLPKIIFALNALALVSWKIKIAKYIKSFIQLICLLPLQFIHARWTLIVMEMVIVQMNLTDHWGELLANVCAQTNTNMNKTALNMHVSTTAQVHLKQVLTKSLKMINISKGLLQNHKIFQNKNRASDCSSPWLCIFETWPKMLMFIRIGKQEVVMPLK